mgnify:CR=1 FL=1
MLSTKLQTVLAVAEYKNFTRAAEELNMTQPAVSHHIKQLEQEVDAPLFVRNKAGLKLTPQGEIVVNYARRMKALHARMSADRHNAYVREQSHRRGARSVQQPEGQIEDNPFYGYHKQSL